MLLLSIAAITILASIPSSERYADLLPGNTGWFAAGLIAIGLNLLSSERLDASGAGRWSLWIFVAQFFTAAALMLTCYGTAGEWILVCGLSLTLIATVRLAAGDTVWSTTLGVPASVLACTMLLHIRDYSSTALPPWLAPMPLLLPTIVNLVDARFGQNRTAWQRVMIAALASAIIAACIIGLSLGSGGSNDDW